MTLPVGRALTALLISAPFGIQQASAQTVDSKPTTAFGLPYEFNAQATFINQNLFPFHSPYVGSLSLASRNETEWTQTYTAYLGLRPAHGLDVYVDPEWSLGNGIGGGTGLAAYPNGDVLRIPGGTGPGASQVPYFARAFVRYTIATGHGEQSVAQDENQIAGDQPLHRLVITAGKLSTADIFDTNAYANSTRTQFMNWALINNAAFDYAADLRGYSAGVAIEWVHPNWSLRAGSFCMPTVANGPTLASPFAQNRGDQIELELHPKLSHRTNPAVVRLMGYRNIADMGTYSTAISQGTPPNIVATRQPDTTKYGVGLNLEQPLADNGDTGLFARIGWDNGTTESYAYTECDSTVGAGIQVSGAKWRLQGDRWSLALLTDGLSPQHREYLAAGGSGFLLGDGKLHYGQEQVLETYYQHQFGKGVQGTVDLQVIKNPGYNQDRGPVPVLSFRLHLAI